MTPERWKDVKRILDAVLDRPAAERMAAADAACAGDAKLRAEVQSLLASHGQAGAFLESTARDAIIRSAIAGRTEPASGARIGPYRVLEQIGRGGMGAVYLAERDDEEYRKRVAIKLLRGDADSASVVGRFRRERQILAELDHSNIARLLDGGTTEQGLPYLVMEYVEGAPIDVYCEAAKLSVEQRLELFRTVCSAVAAAHRKAVIHRDLKPANILVTTEGTPKLLDFGIAKLLTAEAGPEHTVTGTRPMTPEYASPEQWLGRPLGAATDIYSLGLVLYRLLAGRGPYDAALARDDIGRGVCEEEPAPPSAMAPQVRHRLAGDLDAIVLKALRKEPEERYRSVEEFSQDVRRHLEGRPVTARQGRLAYRAGRLVRRNKAAAATAVAMAVLSAVASGLVYRWARVSGPGAATPAGAIRSLAVLPLANLSHDPEQDYFADGMTEALITDLSRIGSLRVVSRTSVMRYKGTQKPLPDIARDLGVDGVVEGSVLRSGERMRITAQLIRASDDRHLWAESYDRELRDVLALQGAVARAIAAQVQAHLTVQEEAALTRRRPVSPAAYVAYMRGRYLWNRRNEESLKSAISHFEQTLREDPAYAPAYSGLADSYFYRGYAFGRLEPRDAMPKARTAALKALELDDTLAEAHTSLALVTFFFDWDWTSAEREFRRAIELNGNYATAHHGYAVFLTAMHRNEEAVAEARRALLADPLSLPVNNIVASVLGAAGRYDEAVEQYRRTLELDPRFAMAQANLGYLYTRMGREKEAVEELLKAAALSAEGAARVGELRRLARRGGLRALWRDELDRKTAEWNGWHWAATDIAALHARLGHRDEAMNWLEKAYRARSGSLMWINMDARDGWKDLRADPRFQDLLRRVGLPQ